MQLNRQRVRSVALFRVVPVFGSTNEVQYQSHDSAKKQQTSNLAFAASDGRAASHAAEQENNYSKNLCVLADVYVFDGDGAGRWRNKGNALAAITAESVAIVDLLSALRAKHRAPSHTNLSKVLKLCC